MRKKQYLREILSRCCLSPAERKRIKADLEHEIESALERGETMEEIMERMGDPDTLAAELFENAVATPCRPFREYRSAYTFFGLPLIHIIRANNPIAVPPVRVAGTRGINIGGRYARQHLPTARGVFAFGPQAKGIVAVGNFSTGLISIGNLSAGIFSIGNVSGGLFTIGNIAIGLSAAFGNAAVGTCSAGNLAAGIAAAGNVAIGTFAIGNEVMGAHSFVVSNLVAQFQQIQAFVQKLDAPAFVRSFFEAVERVVAACMNPTMHLPLFLSIACVLLAVILALCIVPNRLLRQCERE